MKIRPKRLFLVTGSILILALVVAVIVAFANEDRIRKLAIDQLNAALDTEVLVEDIEFSLLRKFPKASIEFKNIKILEKSSEKDKQHLIEAASLFLEFDPFDLISGTYVIDQIQIDQSVVRITLFSDGSDNYHFFKSEGENERFKISLTKVKFKDCLLVYTNFKSADHINAQWGTLELSGQFDQTLYDMKIGAKGLISSLKISDFSLKHPYECDLNLALSVNAVDQKYGFKSASLKLGNLGLLIDGFLQNKENGMDMDLSFIGDDATLASILEFFPTTLANSIADYDASGAVDLSGKIIGLASAQSSPLIDIKFALNQGKLLHKKSRLEANDVYLTGYFSNGRYHSNRSTSFVIDSVYFKGKLGETSGAFSIENFDDIQLKLRVNSFFDLATFKELFENDSLEILTGKCRLNFTMQGDLDSLTSITAKDFKKAQIGGQAYLDQVSFKYKTMPKTIQDITGSFAFVQNRINLDSLSCDISGNKLLLSGQLKNLIPYLFYENEKMTVQAEVLCRDLDLDEFTQSGDAKGNSFSIPLVRSIDLQLSIRAKRVVLRKFEAQNLTMDVASVYPKIRFENMSFEAMEGHYQGGIFLQIMDDGFFLVESELKLRHVNIQALFTQFENFGQKSILAENLSGYADIDLEYESLFDAKFLLIPESIIVRSSIDILNGKLIDYQPVMALSKYIEIEELQEIRFSRLTNEIEISNRQVIIPQMEINSSALQLSLSGRHSFDNEIEYHFQLFLNDFLFKKAKRSQKNQSEFGEIEIDESGRAKLYIRMTGTVDDYKIRLDRKAVRDQWKDNLTQERKELKALFKKEFSKEKENKKVAPLELGIEWEGQTNAPVDETKDKDVKNVPEKKEKKKSLLEKLGGENKEEYETYDPEKYD
ncbi:MAG: AsmA-like C-terminal region-containing protein [Vicingaceae bacterium]